MAHNRHGCFWSILSKALLKLVVGCRVHIENFIRPSSPGSTRRAVGDNGYVPVHIRFHSAELGCLVESTKCSGELI